ncbi:MAG TPA: phenylalanine--tRNA ligase subunit alpha [Candidatus Limnocylindrales bacterium]|nr:phenylalanine--tRNA ligase subunit alpha [Candidatus Limnocylindrales bacterium]
MSEAAESPETIAADAVACVGRAIDRAALEKLRVEYLGKKGRLTGALRVLGSLPSGERPVFGQRVNRAKEEVDQAIAAREAEIRLDERTAALARGAVDVTLPAAGVPLGTIHPISRTMTEICEILGGMGFEIAEGPEIEDDYHNFEALNIPADHPARDMHDTFFVQGGSVLRTHTSPVQIRVMEARRPPVRIIAPGAVYRHDDDVTHSPMFHQIEGLMVDRGITFAHLKGVLTEFLRRVFGRDLAVRLRPSFFPFTEPSAEVDVACVVCEQKGTGLGPFQGTCRVCKGTGWLEILGAGMVHPAVFEAVGYDPEEFSGFAFGLGVERIAMLKYKIDDIRLFYGGDLRFLRQF